MQHIETQASTANRQILPIRWYTLNEAATRLGVARTALYQWLQAGRVPHHRFGRLIRIHPDDLERFVASVRAEGTWKPYGSHSQV